MDSVFPGLDAASNIHPMLVHLPIALWIVALLFWGLGMLRRRDDVFVAGRWLLYLGTLAALVAVGSGFWATAKMGHDTPGHDAVHAHRNLMLVTTGLAVATVVLAFVWRRSESRIARWIQVAMLAATAVVMTLGADRGALLVYGHGIGTPSAADDQHPHQHEGDEHSH